jgi:RNA polymerase sigma-70 factor (ECF subfamily)
VTSKPRHDPPDEVLAERLKQGDRAAGDELMKRHHRLVAKSVYEVVKDLHAVEDLLQDIFFKTFQKIDLYQPDKGKFLPWLVTVARNEALNQRRRTRRLPTPMADPAPEAGFAPMDSPSAQTSKKEVTGVLIEKVNRLDEPARSILTMRILQGKSFELIALKLKQPVDTVKAIFYRNADTLRTTTEAPYQRQPGKNT